MTFAPAEPSADVSDTNSDTWADKVLTEAQQELGMGRGYRPKILGEGDGATPGVSGQRYEQVWSAEREPNPSKGRRSKVVTGNAPIELSHRSGSNNERNPRHGAGGEASRHGGGNVFLTEHPRAWVYKMRQRNPEQAPPWVYKVLLEDKWRRAAARSERAVGRENEPGSSLELFGKNERATAQRRRGSRGGEDERRREAHARRANVQRDTSRQSLMLLSDIS
ncbi:hypothetical protein K438DRAFT_1776668 [Mycena galopus ATCC 62051]|nr:hypothetical protein K438DRAFT_1776668 [Mycena galopus ATCC 62051]